MATRYAKTITVKIPTSIAGWLELAGRDHDAGMTGYLLSLADRDRAERMTDDAWRDRYRMYLQACDLRDELAEAMGTEE